MTRYTVVWTESARDELAALWISAAGRGDITAAARAIDADLTHDPENKGNAVSEGLRVLMYPPLRTFFCVLEDDRIVEVLRVRST